jgi:hypothetical protein
MERLLKRHWMEKIEDRLRLTDRGLLLADAIALEILCCDGDSA